MAQDPSDLGPASKEQYQQQQNQINSEQCDIDPDKEQIRLSTMNNDENKVQIIANHNPHAEGQQYDMRCNNSPSTRKAYSLAEDASQANNFVHGSNKPVGFSSIIGREQQEPPRQNLHAEQAGLGGKEAPRFTATPSRSNQKMQQVADHAEE